MATQVIVAALAVVVATAVLIGLVFVVQLILAPVRQRNSTRRRVRELEEELSDPQLVARDAEREERRQERKRELRRATTLIVGELEEARARALDAREYGEEWARHLEDLSTKRWKEGSPLIGERQGLEQVHSALRQAYRDVEKVNRVVDKRQAFGFFGPGALTGEEAPETPIAVLDDLIEVTRSCEKALEWVSEYLAEEDARMVGN